MTTLSGQAATQLSNVLEATGKTVEGFAAEVLEKSLEKHGQIVSFFKSEHGLTHGNANLLAHVVREHIAGGPRDGSALLEAQYSGPKSALLPIFEKLAKAAMGMGDDVEQVIQKTGVSFRRKKNFLVVNAASAKRIQLGLNLNQTPDGDRCIPTKGMCNHKASVYEVSEVDAEVLSWIRDAYKSAI